MKFLMTYTPASTDTSPDAARGAAMRQYSEDMLRAGVLLSQGMFGTHAAEVRLDGGRYSVTEAPDGATGYAFIEAASREEAIEGAREFLGVAGDGVTRVREVREGGRPPA